MTALDTLDLAEDDHVDLDFACRAAGYLRDQGLDQRAVAIALRAELGLPTPDAIRLAALDTTPNQQRQGEPHGTQRS